MGGKQYETDVCKIRDNLMEECRYILDEKSFHYNDTENGIHVVGFSPEIIIQVLRNALEYPSPLLLTMLDIRGTENNTTISLKV